METKSSNVLVGSIVIVLIVAIFAAILWLSKVGGNDDRPFDIFFKQSVSGLAKGSQVQFAGVPVGSVDQIKLMPETPEFVRVRIKVDPDVPVLQGTTATISGVGFTGVSVIQLDGAIKGAAPIVEPGPFGAPVIPTKPGALGELLASAPELLNNLSNLTERLSETLSPANQKSIQGILANGNVITKSFADRSQEIAATVAEARFAVRELGLASEKFGRLADKSDPLIADLRQTTQRANATLASLQQAADSARPAIQTVSTQTLPEVGQLVHDLREVTANLGAISAKLDEDPAGAIVGGRKLPEYDPNPKKKKHDHAK